MKRRYIPVNHNPWQNWEWEHSRQIITVNCIHSINMRTVRHEEGTGGTDVMHGETVYM